MSAYLCSDEHIRQLAAYLATDSQDLLRHYSYNGVGSYGGNGFVQQTEFADAVAAILLAENYRSLSARYGDEEEPHKLEPITLGEIERMRTVTPGKMVNPIRCYHYQACESDDYERTMAYKIVGWLKDLLLKRIPGYEDGEWGTPVKFEKPAAEIISLFGMAK